MQLKWPTKGTENCKRQKSEELGGLLSLLSEIDLGKLNGKQAWTFNQQGLTPYRSEAQNLVEAALRVVGIVVLPTEILCTTSGEDLITRLKEVGRSLATHRDSSG